MPTDHPSDRFGEPWSDATYRGFAGPPPPEPRGRFRLPRISQRQLAIGAGAAVGLGLLLGLWARPNLGASHDTDAAERTAPAVPVEVNRPAPPKPLVSDGKLQVLPPDMAAAARPAASVAQTVPAAPSPATSPSATSPSAMPSLAPPPPAPRGPTVLRGNPPPLSAPSASGPAAMGRTDTAGCAGAGGAADQMVCGDPDLASADREMRRAYRRALQSGAAPGALRADQRDWMSIREEAARHSRRALAQVYEQRIDELNAAAADRDGAQEDPEF